MLAVLKSPDSITKGNTIDLDGHDGILYTKRLNGKYNDVLYDATKKLDLRIQTMYINVEKKNVSVPTAPSANHGFSNTSETNSGIAHEPSLSQNPLFNNSENVKERFSLEEPVEQVRDLVAVHNVDEDGQRTKALNDAMDSEGNVRYSLDTLAERMALYL